MHNKNTKINYIALCGILTTLGFCLSYIESFIPLNLLIPVPGIRLGLANIVTLFALQKLNTKYAFAIMFLRCILQNILFGSASAFLFSLCGGILSLLIMACLNKFDEKYFSIFGISIAGACCHNIGQILIAIIYFNSISFIFYLPILLILSIPTGFLTGFVANIVVNKLSKINIFIF